MTKTQEITVLEWANNYDIRLPRGSIEPLIEALEVSKEYESPIEGPDGRDKCIARLQKKVCLLEQFIATELGYGVRVYNDMLEVHYTENICDRETSATKYFKY